MSAYLPFAQGGTSFGQTVKTVEPVAAKESDRNASYLQGISVGVKQKTASIANI
jgi:hypothetical protein